MTRQDELRKMVADAGETQLAISIARLRAENQRLRDMLKKSANRLDWCAGLLVSERARDQATDWADEARATLETRDGT